MFLLNGYLWLDFFFAGLLSGLNVSVLGLKHAHMRTLRPDDSAEISSSPRAVKYSVSTTQELQSDSLEGINSKHCNNAL